EREQRELGLDDDTQCTFASDEPVDRVVRKRVADGVLLEVRSAKFDQLATRQNYFQRAYVSSSRTILEGPRSRRVAGDCPANGRLFLTRRIRREEQTSCC